MSSSRFMIMLTFDKSLTWKSLLYFFASLYLSSACVATVALQSPALQSDDQLFRIIPPSLHGVVIEQITWILRLCLNIAFYRYLFLRSCSLGTTSLLRIHNFLQCPYVYGICFWLASAATPTFLAGTEWTELWTRRPAPRSASVNGLRLSLFSDKLCNEQ